MDISKRIIELRENKKISPSDIADKIGIERTNYYRLEKRGDKLTIEQLKQIAGALGVELNELLGIEVQTVDNERVKELEKRILELEDRVNDKDLIIKALQKDAKDIEKDLIEALAMAILGIAKRHNMVKVKLSQKLRGGYEEEYNFNDFDENKIDEKFIIKHYVIEESNIENLYNLKDTLDIDFILETVLIMRKQDVYKGRIDLFKELCNEVNNFYPLPTKHYSKFHKNKENDRN